MTPQGLREVLARHISAPDGATTARRVGPPDAAQTVSPPEVQTTLRSAIDQLRERFIAGLPERTHVLEEAWRAGDRTALAQAAHQLKGTSGAYGLRSIAQAAEAIEMLAKGEGMLSELQQAVHELLAHLSQVSEAGRSGTSGTTLQK
jgi:HPt (histidine-containing phosphotransfer) domain-containing protein